MTSPKTQPAALSVGQLARRWGVGVDRVRKLAESGLLPGSFRVPSAGRYGEAVRVPMANVLQAEQDWTISAEGQERTDRAPRRSRRETPPQLTHFPELNVQPGDECHEDGQH